MASLSISPSVRGRLRLLRFLRYGALEEHWRQSLFFKLYRDGRFRVEFIKVDIRSN